MDDQPCRDDSERVGASGDVLGAARPDFVAEMIEPRLVPCPDRRRNAEMVPELALPLQGERRRHEQQDRAVAAQRSEEHTSELQSLMRISYAVFCLKKKKHINKNK